MKNKKDYSKLFGDDHNSNDSKFIDSLKKIYPEIFTENKSKVTIISFY